MRSYHLCKELDVSSLEHILRIGCVFSLARVLQIHETTENKWVSSAQKRIGESIQPLLTFLKTLKSPSFRIGLAVRRRCTKNALFGLNFRIFVVKKRKLWKQFFWTFLADNLLRASDEIYGNLPVKVHKTRWSFGMKLILWHSWLISVTQTVNTICATVLPVPLVSSFKKVNWIQVLNIK
jgi:hypothetical protein